MFLKLIKVNNVSIMAGPGIICAVVQIVLIRHCEKMTNRAILDVSSSFIDANQMCEHREQFDISNVAMYHPWLNVFDSLLNKNTYVPSSGAMVRIYARGDNTRGDWEASVSEIVRNAIALSVNYNQAVQGKLNPKGLI